MTPTPGRKAAFTQDGKATPARDMLSDLHRLIEALDRRVPRLERDDEAQIAHDASDLRERALSLIRRIEDNAP